MAKSRRSHTQGAIPNAGGGTLKNAAPNFGRFSEGLEKLPAQEREKLFGFSFLLPRLNLFMARCRVQPVWLSTVINKIQLSINVPRRAVGDFVDF